MSSIYRCLVSVYVVLLLVGCNNAPSQIKVVTHEGVESPAKIMNLFPEHGLTDPHVWIENGRLYLFGGHDASWLTNRTWTMDRWELWSTTDLATWQLEQQILPTQTYIGNEPNCWAGDIVCRNEQYYWYFSNRSKDTGVMRAHSITGEYIDALGKPLLPEGLIQGHCYDPEIVIDNGNYYIIFSAGVYHIAQLANDMISLATEPTPIKVIDKEGNSVWTDDKSCMFIRNGIYYLVWGSHYATATSLYGTYTYQGAFLAGGHSSVFEWDGEWYVVQENKDLSLFYRGISLKPISFDEDGNIIIPDSDYDYPGNSRTWLFENSEMGWHAVSSTSLAWNNEGRSIQGKLSGECAAIESCTWLLTPTKKFSRATITLRNSSSATEMAVYLATYSHPEGNFWEHPEINWSEEWCSHLPIAANSDEFITYSIDIECDKIGDILKAIRIEPASNATIGKWEIADIAIK